MCNKDVATLSVKINRAIIVVIDNQCIGINGRVTLKFTRPRYNWLGKYQLICQQLQRELFESIECYPTCNRIHWNKLINRGILRGNTLKRGAHLFTMMFHNWIGVIPKIKINCAIMPLHSGREIYPKTKRKNVLCFQLRARMIHEISSIPADHYNETSRKKRNRVYQLFESYSINIYRLREW